MSTAASEFKPGDRVLWTEQAHPSDRAKGWAIVKEILGPATKYNIRVDLPNGATGLTNATEVRHADETLPERRRLIANAEKIEAKISTFKARACDLIEKAQDERRLLAAADALKRASDQMRLASYYEVAAKTARARAQELEPPPGILTVTVNAPPAHIAVSTSLLNNCISDAAKLIAADVHEVIDEHIKAQIKSQLDEHSHMGD